MFLYRWINVLKKDLTCLGKVLTNLKKNRLIRKLIYRIRKRITTWKKGLCTRLVAKFILAKQTHNKKEGGITHEERGIWEEKQHYSQAC